jgi:hydrogenase expression/formation protein HypC
MCLAVPMKIVELGADGNAVCEYDGVRRGANVSFLDRVGIGDYVIVHAGYAIERLNVEEAEAQLETFRELGLILDAQDAAAAARAPAP